MGRLVIRKMSPQGAETEALLMEADTTRRAALKDFICIHGIIEFSNYCTKDCAYCGLREPNREIERYRMDPGEIVECARRAVVEKGYKLIVLQSGEDPHYTDALLTDVIRRIEAGERDLFF